MRVVKTILCFAAAVFLAGNDLCAERRYVTVSGSVSDAASGEALPGVGIVSETSAGTVVSAFSDAGGRYSLKLASGKVRLVFSMTGYETEIRDLDLSKDTILYVGMVMKSEELGEVVFTAKQNSFASGGSGKITVNSSQIKYAPSFLGEKDVIKYMQMIPGVISGRDGSSQLAVRGGSGDQTLIMLDDAPVFNQNHAFGYVSVFNSDAVNVAELYKGHISPQYGGRLSSVAALRMRDGNKYEHHQSLSVGTIAASGMAEGPVVKGKGSYLVSARRFMPDLLFIRPYWAIRKNKGFEMNYWFYDLNARVNYKLGQSNTLYASFYNGKDKVSQLSRSYSFDEEKGSMVQSSVNGSSFSWMNTSASVRLNTVFSGGAVMDNVIYCSFLGNRENAYAREIGGKDNTSLTTSGLSEYGLRSVVEHSLSRSHTLVYGTNISLTRFTPYSKVNDYSGNVRKWSREYMNLYSFSIFAEDRIRFGSYRFDLGARASLFRNGSRTMYAVEPRISMARSLGRDNSMWLTYTRNTQPLVSVSSTFMYFPVEFWLPFLGNRLESSDQISLGADSRNIPNLELSAEIYVKKYDNLSYIRSSDDYLTGDEQPKNAEGHAYGIELMGQYSLPSFSVSLSYTYSRSMRTVDGVTFPFVYDIPHNLNLYSTYTTLKRPGRLHTLSLNLICRSGLPFSFSNEQFPLPGGTVVDNDFGPSEVTGVVNYPEYANERMNPYFQLNLSYSMERKKRRGHRVWQFSLLNATNHINPNIVYRDGANYKYFTTMPIMPAVSYSRYF